MQNIQNDISQNNFKQVYLLYGDERYLVKQYAGLLRKALCNADDQMNTHFYEGKDTPVGEIIDLAETMPFLADRRVIFINDSGLFKSGGEKMAEYMTAPCSTTCFVFTEREIDKRSKLFKAVQSNGRAVEFTAQDEKKLKTWIASILEKEGKKITESTALLFLQKTGTDMETIRMELEKLICYAYDRDVITAEDVEAICTPHITSRIFDMINHIAFGRQKEALQLYYDLLTLKEPPMRILFHLTRQFNHMLRIKDLRSQGFDFNSIAPKVGLSPYIVRKCAEQAERFNQSALRATIEHCAETEESVKQGRMNDIMGVELLILSIK